jgi:cellulase (glycosyl hydrolase family 5)/invasin-like protein
MTELISRQSIGRRPAQRGRLLAASVAAAVGMGCVLPAVASPSARHHTHRHVVVSLNRTEIPALGRLQPRPHHYTFSSRWASHNGYAPDPTRPRVTARVTDSTGKPVTNEKVTFTAGRGVRFGKVTNHHNGRYTAFVISGSKPGHVAIRAHATRHDWVSRPVTLTETFGRLHTVGSHIRDAAGNNVLLRGVNFQIGLPDSYFINEFPPRSVYDEFVKTWKPNVVRLFVDLAQWTRPCVTTRRLDHYDADYRTAVQSYVSAMTDRGVFVILVLGSNPRKACDDSTHRRFALKSSNERLDAGRFWAKLAAMYRANPLVGFDLYNEPHDISNTIWQFGGVVHTEPRWHAAGMQPLLGAVRSAGAHNLVFVEGPVWGNVVPPSLLHGSSGAAATNVVYTAHYYACPKRDRGYPGDGSVTPYRCGPGVAPPTPGTPCPSGSVLPAWADPGRVLRNWSAWRSSHDQPIMEDEFGWPGNSSVTDTCFVKATVDYDEAHNISWSAYAFELWSDHVFSLARHPIRHNFTPTTSGCAVYARLSGRSC